MGYEIYTPRVMADVQGLQRVMCASFYDRATEPAWGVLAWGGVTAACCQLHRVT